MTESQDERLGLPSASSWRRFELCPGSWQLEQEAKKLNQEAHVGGAAAERGERIHAWLAGIPDEDGNEIKLRDDEAVTADFLMERATGERIRIFGDQQVGQLDEHRLWLLYPGPKKALSGRFDRVIWTPTVALCQDFKTGWSEPDPAEQNAQLKVLAVLVALHMPPTLKEVIVQIISGPFGVTEARYDLRALAEAYNSILATLRAIHVVDAPLKPSPEACQYCPATLICSAVKNLVLPVTTKAQAVELPDGEEGARFLDEIELAMRYLETAKGWYATKLALDPTYNLPGYALVPGAVRREVTDWEAARQRLGEWLELDEINGAANYRLGDLEKALGAKLKLKGAALKERMNEILRGLIEEKPNAASLKRVSANPKQVSAGELPQPAHLKTGGKD
jgi:PD-(D/E)XK nuclease superfamily